MNNYEAACVIRDHLREYRIADGDFRTALEMGEQALMRIGDPWRMFCPKCGTGDYVIYDADEDMDSMIVSFLHCTKCGCEMQFCIPNECPYEEPDGGEGNNAAD